uniref:Glycosyl transferase, group 1 n=1 Tax=Erysipelothrix rhusiopathiae TaxID=1648 RepID=A0A6S6I4Z1_ERYRH|nr:glycosyl transferase, group 1 [Erysipelothrix rhusiopathiae]
MMNGIANFQSSNKTCLIVTTVGITIKTFLIPHIEYLKKNGFEVILASNFSDSSAEELIVIESANCELVNIEFSRNPLNISKHVQSNRQMSQLIKSRHFDKIFVHTPIASFITRKVARKSDCEVTYFAHGLQFYKGGSKLSWVIFEPMERLASKWTQNIITMNQEDYNYFQGLKRKKTKVIKIPGIGLSKSFVDKIEISKNDSIKTNIEIEDDDVIILSIGELNKNKNHILMLETMKKIVSINNKVKYFIIGVGPRYEEYETFIKNHNLENNVELLGYINNVVPYIVRSNLVVSCSFREGLPISIIESMALGKPVLASNIRGHIDLIKDDLFLYELKEDKIDLFNKVLNLINNKQLLDKQGKFNQIESSSYKIDNVLSSLREIYE